MGGLFSAKLFEPGTNLLTDSQGLGRLPKRPLAVGQEVSASVLVSSSRPGR